ncbi:MAG: 50S ribosomal protein P1, partial [Nanoarchaeota archaeon]
LEAAGTRVDETKVKALVISLENVNIEEVIKEATVTQVVAQPVEAKVEKEEKKEEKVSEETAAAGLSSLFG